jgi:hypothetical protein
VRRWSGYDGSAHTFQALLNHLERLKMIATLPPTEPDFTFVLDPLSEYLAALNLLREYQDDDVRWREFLSRADNKPGAPQSIRGFLVAVRDCCLARPQEVPGWLADQLARRVTMVMRDGSADPTAGIPLDASRLLES